MKYLPLLLLIGLVSCKNETPKTVAEKQAPIEYESAFDSINSLIKAKPDNALLYNYRATLRENDKDFESAIGDLNRAIEVDSLNDQWYIRKANLLFHLERFKESKDVLDNAIFIVPGSVPLMLRKSEIYLVTGDLQQCLNWANAALNFDVYSAQAYYLKGMAHKYGRDTVKSVTSFQTAVEQDINHYEAYMQLANLYAIEKHDLAPSYYQNALRIKPKSIEAYYGKGLHFQNIGRSDLALNDYKAILEINDKYPEAYYNMGYVKLIQLREIDTAAVLFNKAYGLDGTYFDALYMIGYCQELKNEIQQAKKTYKTVLENVPTHLLAAKGLSRVE
jgi:tetratricopeptide (TPR) repeat protein